MAYRLGFNLEQMGLLLADNAGCFFFGIIDKIFFFFFKDSEDDES